MSFLGCGVRVEDAHPGRKLAHLIHPSMLDSEPALSPADPVTRSSVLHLGADTTLWQAWQSWVGVQSQIGGDSRPGVWSKLAHLYVRAGAFPERFWSSP